jgi:CubicO group peptidase (beta-lactamase class C family)
MAGGGNSSLWNTVEGIFRDAVRATGAVGAQLSIESDGERRDLVAGLANAELNIPMTSDTVVQLGSVTKVFNATMIMSLVEEGRLDLDTPVVTYIPELQLSTPEATRSVTLRHLLSMSSGLDNGDYGEYGEADDAVARRMRSAASLRHHFEPGRYFGYANVGSDIAAHAAERVTGRVWDDLLAERVLRKAALTNTVTLADDRMFQRVSVGHVVEADGTPRVVRPWSRLTRGQGPGGGNFAASARDLARFGSMFLAGGIADSGNRILSRETVAAMTTSQVAVPMHYYATSWCLGPFRHEWDGVAVWGHHGGTTSGQSFLYWIPERNGVIAFTCNTVRGPVWARMVAAITTDVVSQVFGISNARMSAPPSPVAFDPDRYIGTYEAAAGRSRVDLVDGSLRLTKTWTLIDDIAETFSLIPLGDDRFLIDRGEASDPAVLPEDTAFFGSDARGRATNLLGSVFPFSRTDP